MVPFFKCDIECFSSPHLNQIYDGFSKLEQSNIVRINKKKVKGSSTKPILKVFVNNKYVVIYDLLDGFNWINDTIENNLYHFSEHYDCDFYFKRNFNDIIYKYAPKNCRVYPLGFNYCIDIRLINQKYIKEIFNRLSKNNTSTSFEFPPVLQRDFFILFFERLWDPNDISSYDSSHLRDERKEMLERRISYLNACKNEFKDYFLGGLIDNNVSRKYAKNLIVSHNLTEKHIFLKNIKRSSVCIATNGLHGSIGWRFGEYIAASRAILTEPLRYTVPGRFKEGNNYLSYQDENELIENIYYLMFNKKELLKLMWNNYIYYNSYLTPKKLVLNTLLRVHFDTL
ncbi:MAG: hypothetical protein U5L00_03735 [Desulfovermiculus sp.]|nr:hypothetical protein [Desulfovermiculus sp.]